MPRQGFPYQYQLETRRPSPMKAMVCLKQVPHQDARLDVAADGSWIQEDNIKFEINSYDTYALEEALRIKDADGDTEVVVVSVGPDRVTQALRTALGMGADRAVHVNDPETQNSDSLGIAKILAAVAKEENPDMIFCGLMADDGNFSAVPPMLAELLDMPSATSVLATDFGDSVKVERELEGGAMEVVELPKPCLLAIQTGANQVRYASLKGIMQAKKKPVDVKTAGDLGIGDQVGAGAAKVKVTKIYVPPKSDTAELYEGSTDEIVGQLVGKIKELGLL
ncbi:MAG: electron transfer flavoprotein subunit beta [Spirochaeta sp.]|nr:electron transfer flavoprotein subunit beta [Spirochaeta sp.]RPG11781.1 MAG: electron transfer flavoprotein subunit beta/FixA family protein [Proteobacteria bacterium TMED72]